MVLARPVEFGVGSSVRNSFPFINATPAECSPVALWGGNHGLPDTDKWGGVQGRSRRRRRRRQRVTNLGQ